MNDNKNENINEKSKAVLTGAKRAVPILLAAVAVFLFACYLTKETGGLLGSALSSFMLGLFSYGGYAVPPLLLLHALFFRDDVKEGRVLSRIIFSVITVLLISVIDYAVAYWWVEPVFIPTELYASASAGGFIGSTVAFAIIKAIGHVGLIILVVAILALYATFFFARGDGAARRLIITVLSAMADAAAAVERKIKNSSEKRKSAKDSRSERGADERMRELTNDDFFAVDNGMAELSIRELGIKETRDEREGEADPHLHESVYHKSGVDRGSERESAARRPDFSYAEEQTAARENAREDDIIIEADEPKTAAQKSQEARADDVFTKEFNPYDFATAEAEIARQNERALSDGRGVSSYERPLSDVTPEDAERLRRTAEFEKKKRELVERARREAEERERASAEAARLMESEDTEDKTEPVEKAAPEAAAIQETVPETVPETVVSPTPDLTAKEEIKKTVEFSFGDSRSPSEVEGVSVTYGKPEASHDDTEAVAAAVAERIFASNPAYARSMNPMSTRTTVREDEDVAVETVDAIVEPYEKDADSELYEAETDGDSVITEFETETDVALDESVPDFKPYEPETVDITLSEDEEDEPELLYTERSMVSPEPVLYEYEAEEYTEDSGNEEALPPLDDRDEIFGEELDTEDGEDDPTPIPEAEQNPEVIKMREQFPFLFETEEKEEAAIESAAEIIEEETEEEVFEEAYEEPVPEPLPTETPKPVKPTPTPAPTPEKQEPKKPKRPDYSDYKYPPIDLLTVAEDVADEHIQEEIQENADRLIDTLASFNVTASIKGVDRGPRITRYEVVPAKGVKVSSVMSLQDDIALNLAAESIRMEAPIPGKSAVGVEIPNKKSSTVRLRELLETEDFTNSKSKTTVCMGKDVAGQPIIADIAKMPHALIAGATGMGKSVCINSLMISMLYKARPDEVKFIMIDPKQVEFTMYNGIPHLLVPIVNDVKQAAGTLMWAVEEMEKRYNMLQEACVRNIDGYNEKAAAGQISGEPLPRIVIVIDEFAELIMQVKNPVESLVIRIAQTARAAGIHLIIGTQKPVKEVITGLIKSNIPTKMSCKVLSNRDSILIFDQSGAEKLLDKGDMLVSFAASPKPQRVQCAFVSDGEVEAVMEHLKQFSSGEGYDETVMEDIRRAADKCTRKGGGDSDDDSGDESGGEGYLNDKQFLDAVEVALSMGKISTSLIQRKISVGYGKAAKFIDVMESLGIVSEPNGQKPRDVLMTKDEWREKLARTTYD